MTTPDNFLGLEANFSALDRAGVLVLPIPFEATVSYGGGTAAGPDAIIAASQQVELYDREVDLEPALRYGVHTLPALDLPDDPAAAVAIIRTAVAGAARSGKLLVGLGGEHTISAGVGHGLLDALGGPLTVVQIDAHSDLRDEYEGTPYSHACVARRLLDDPAIEQVLQLGIRSVCPEEVTFVRAHPNRARVWYTEQVHDGSWHDEFITRVRGATRLSHHRRGRAGPGDRTGDGHARARRPDLVGDARDSAHADAARRCRGDGLRRTGAGAGAAPGRLRRRQAHLQSHFVYHDAR
jgi:agmatinase